MSAQRKNKKEVVFQFEAGPSAQDVFVAGEFNNWNPQATRMVRKGGQFTARLFLPPGKYQYKYVVDGQWQQDPTAGAEVGNEFGGFNSVASV